jgi:thiamine-phosphate pyrophosphorylase
LPPSPRPRVSPNPPRLYAIVDDGACAAVGRAPLEVARAFLAGGARLLQLRCKSMPGGAFLDLARAVMAEASRARATVIVNDRADVARLSAADGLHVGQTDLSAADARQVIGPEAWLGLSTHSREQWEQALREPVSYIAIGPAFSTATKDTGYDAVGLKVVRAAAAAAAVAGVPLVAIGGITIDNAAAVIEAGASSVAVIGALLDGDPEARCREFVRRLE